MNIKQYLFLLKIGLQITYLVSGVLTIIWTIMYSRPQICIFTGIFLIIQIIPTEILINSILKPK